MVKKIKSLVLMGQTITVSEKYEGEFESEKRFMEENKHLFKCQSGRTEKPKPKPKPKPRTCHIHPHSMSLPSRLIEAIEGVGGTGVSFLMEKSLEDSDVNKYQNRIYVPKEKEFLDSLTENEKQIIEKQGKEGGLKVSAIDSRGEIYNLNLKKWLRAGGSKYVLIKEWGTLVQHNGLQKDDLVQIWYFRVDSKLHLAVNAVKKLPLALTL